jgi:predicted nucleic acid-binding protein
MILAWCDTNVILRHLTGEPADLAARAHAAMAEVEAGRLRLRVATEVVAELVYVLTGRTYRYTRKEVADHLTALLSIDGIEAEEPDLCLVALARMSELNVPFVDALLAARALALDEPVATFDERDFPRLGVTRHPI